jgi:hypothetical protein
MYAAAKGAPLGRGAGQHEQISSIIVVASTLREMPSLNP